nr:hypothetical protein [Tanacetum cinerariifolium]
MKSRNTQELKIKGPGSNGITYWLKGLGVTREHLGANGGKKRYLATVVQIWEGDKRVDFDFPWVEFDFSELTFKLDTRKNVLDLEAFREILHISPRVSGQSFTELPFEEEILEFVWFLGHSAKIKTLTDVNVNKHFQPWRSFAAVINKCLTGKSYGIDSLRDDILFSTIKVVSRHQDTQQYGAILHIELTSEDIRNTKAYKEYYACATGEAAPKPKASARKKQKISKIGEQEATESDEGKDDATESGGKHYVQEAKQTPGSPLQMVAQNTKAYKEYYACTTGEAAPKPKASARKKQSSSASSTTPPTPIATPTSTTTVVAAPRLTVAAKEKQPARARSPTEPSDVERTEAEQLKIVLKRSRQETYISQRRGFSTDKGTDEAKKVNDDDDDEKEISKIGEQEATESDEGEDDATESGGESKDEETREQEEESFDPIPRTPEYSEDDGNNEEDQGLRIGEDESIPSTPSELATGSTGRSTTGTQSRQHSASESAFVEEPVQTTFQMEEPAHLVFETGAEDQPIV